MIWTSKRFRTPIGLDVGTRRIKAVQLTSSGSICAALSLPRIAEGGLPSPQEVERLGDVLYRQGFGGHRLVLVAPMERTPTGLLQLPPRASGAPLEQIARVELARINKWEPGTFEMTFWDLPAAARATDGSQAMAVACPHEVADTWLAPFEQVGFDVIGLDAAPLAAARACRPMFDDSGINAILDIGWSSAQLLVLHQGAIIYERRLAQACVNRARQHMMDQLAMSTEAADWLIDQMLGGPNGASESADEQTWQRVERLLSDLTDDLARDLEASFTYAMHRHPDAQVKSLLLIGGGASLAGWAQRLTEKTGVSARAVSPAELAVCDPGIERPCHQPALTAALGLARYEEA